MSFTPRRRRPAAALRFPCGHLEPEPVTKRRLRRVERAVWVRCAHCNVIAIAVRSVSDVLRDAV
jgi:hypothetical protein